VADNIESAKKKFSVPPAALVIGLVGLVGLGAFLILEREARRPAPEPPPISGEAKEYVKNLRLLDVNMAAKDSYLKHSLVEITGKIGNDGERVLQLVEINCIFYDYYGQVVLRQRVQIVSRKMGSLAPGEIKNFRLPFDNVPESWNQAMPQLVIARIDFP
jgi:hypothetical protein